MIAQLRMFVNGYGKLFSRTIVFALFIVTSLNCKNALTGSKERIGYDLENPTRILKLPPILREISGITLLDSTTIACVQDENGILFLYDISGNKIKKQISFYENGDYEGICSVDSLLFVLRSDGALFEVEGYRYGKPKVIRHATEMSGSNNEGLCYDKEHNRLLIARKNRVAKEKEFRNKRVVYEFDLKRRLLNANPVFEFDVDSIKKMAEEDHLGLPKKNKKKNQAPEPFIRFASSEIAIHPITKKIVLLSSADHLLFIIDQNGKVEHIEKLNPILFRKPEGIAFQQNGDMLISNEGKEKNSTLLGFKYN